MLKLPHTRSCFVCGLNNPLGLKLDFETDGRIVRAHFAPRPEHVGFRETVHGGLIATVLDEAMVWVIGVRGRDGSLSHFVAHGALLCVGRIGSRYRPNASPELCGSESSPLWTPIAEARNSIAVFPAIWIAGTPQSG